MQFYMHYHHTIMQDCCVVYIGLYSLSKFYHMLSCKGGQVVWSREIWPIKVDRKVWQWSKRGKGEIFGGSPTPEVHTHTQWYHRGAVALCGPLFQSTASESNLQAWVCVQNWVWGTNFCFVSQYMKGRVIICHRGVIARGVVLQKCSSSITYLSYLPGSTVHITIDSLGIRLLIYRYGLWSAGRLVHPFNERWNSCRMESKWSDFSSCVLPC